MLAQRIRLLQAGIEGKGPVVYWMSRDQRAADNWALEYSLQLAQRHNSFVVVAFSLVPEFLEATRRQHGFMLRGLQETAELLDNRNIPFILLQGTPDETIAEFCSRVSATALVADFDPLRIKRIWKREVAKKIAVPFYEVDAHNIVPCLVVSQKEEFAAYTIRPKINKLLPQFLDSLPESPRQKNVPEGFFENIDWQSISAALKIDESVTEVQWIEAGEKAASEKLNEFLESGLSRYSDDRNNPALGGQSNLSPYLHFGHLSAQRVALEVLKRFRPTDPGVEAFLEELIIRRELADNFCYYNTAYDSVAGFANWAKLTLQQHTVDKREYIYSGERFENARTHDELWNAAQRELVQTGKMHGFMRMYWAKKNLEWTESPEQALRMAIYLNDKYELDGRDPNGYAGCAWAIGGVHDRAWFERPVFGKIRYMNYNGCKRKFDIDAYISKAF
jgi:deoxyribodipyrimidine photo-lyase